MEIKLKKIKVNKNVNWTLVIRSNLKCSNQPNSQDIIGVDILWKKLK